MGGGGYDCGEGTDGARDVDLDEQVSACGGNRQGLPHVAPPNSLASPHNRVPSLPIRILVQKTCQTNIFRRRNPPNLGGSMREPPSGATLGSAIAIGFVGRTTVGTAPLELKVTAVVGETELLE